MDKLAQFLRSLCTLVLVGGLAAPMSLWSRVAFAFLPAPLSPAYLVTSNDKFGTCTSGYRISTSGQPLCSSFIGYVYTSQVPGTSPAYLVASNDKFGVCIGGSYRISTSSQPLCSSFIGYVNTSQVPGTSPAYLVDSNDKWGVCYANGYRISASGQTRCSSFIGYIYPTLPAPTTFTVYPSYFIGSVIYAPPGLGPSSVTYGSGTVTGTTVSTTDSWGVNSSIGVSFGTGDTSSSVTFGDDFQGQTTNTVDMQNTSNQSAFYKGPVSDSINHDYDLIQIFLGVQVPTSVDYLGHVTAGVDFSHIADSGFSQDGYTIEVGCLRPNSTVPTADCTARLNFFNAHNITSADYPSMLGADPFWDPNNLPPTIDPNRYVFVHSTDYFANADPSGFNFSLTNNITHTNSETRIYKFTVGSTLSIPIADTGFVLKDSNTFTWTISSTLTTKTGSTGSEAFALSPPSVSYPVGTLFVYMDTMFKTFMFQLQ